MIIIRDVLDSNLGLKKKEIANLRKYIHKPSEVIIGVLIGLISALIAKVLV